MIFMRDSLCLSAITLSRQRRDILDFSNCPLSRVLHVALANWQGFGFEVITKIEKCLLLFNAETNVLILLYWELKTDGKSFIFAVCRLP